MAGVRTDVVVESGGIISSAFSNIPCISGSSFTRAWCMESDIESISSSVGDDRESSDSGCKEVVVILVVGVCRGFDGR